MDAPFKPGDLVVFRDDDSWTRTFQGDLGSPGPYRVLLCASLGDGRVQVVLAGGKSPYDAGYFVLAPREEG